MDKLIIATSTVAYGGTRTTPSTAEQAYTPDLLGAGCIGMYGFHRYSDGIERFALITHTAATSFATPASYVAKDTDFTGRQIKFYVGANSSNSQAANSTSQPRQSSEISLKGIRRLVGTPYQASVLEVSTITFPALPTTTATVYDEYFIHITRNPITKEVDAWSFQVQGIFANLAALATALAAQINARHFVPFTASVSGSTLVITAKNFTETFIFGFDGFLYPSTVVKSPTMVVGSGNYWQLQYKEKNFGGEQGWQDQLDRRMPGIDALALSTGQYDIYLIDFVNVLDLKDEMDDTFSNQETLVVAIPQGSSQASEFEAIFTQFQTRNLLSVPLELNNTAQTVNGTTTTTTT